MHARVKYQEDIVIINEAGDAITMLTAKVINHKQKFSKNKLR
jgi:hypothetical protein